MKIGIDISQIQYEATGVGNYVRELVTNLLEFDKKNQYLLFGCSYGNHAKLKSFSEQFSGVKSVILPLPRKIDEWLFNVWHSVPIETFTGELDVFHASDWTQPRSKNAKIVTTVHDLTAVLYKQYQHPTIIAAQERRMSLVNQEAAMMIADSEATKYDLVKLFHTPEEKICVVYLAASRPIIEFGQLTDDRRQQQIGRVKSKFDLADEYLLSVGTNEPRKNLENVIKAFIQLAKDQAEQEHIQLVIAGKYGWGEEISNKIPPELKNRIRVLGMVPDQDLAPLLAGAKVLVYPSFYEGFGLPVLEAMTLGTPVVTTDRGSLKEVAGKAAVLVDPESVAGISAGIRQALVQPEELKKLGLKQAANFSWRKTAQETLAVYQRVSN